MGRRSEFSREEKIAAVKLVTEGGRSLLSVANEYGIHENTRWESGSDSTRSIRKVRSTGSPCWTRPAHRSGNCSSSDAGSGNWRMRTTF